MPASQRRFALSTSLLISNHKRIGVFSIEMRLLMLLLLVGVVLGAPCSNTVQGAEFVADDTGRLCSRVETEGGCCPRTADRFVCELCDLAQRCCPEYEVCVSCCVAPANGEERSAGLLRRRRTSPLYAHILATHAFRYCRARCRTSAASLFHQNRYKNNDAHFCYGGGGDS